MLALPVACRTLRARQPVQLVMIHGLFSNGAFWIPYLSRFENFQVTLLSVDYGEIFRTGLPLWQVAERVDQLIGDKPAHLIGHSFGSWLGLLLQSPLSSRSFICPTFAALEFRGAAFRSEIAKRTAVNPDEIEPLVAFAVDYKAQHVNDLQYRSTDNFYLPTDDPYFRYVERLDEGVTHEYCGGHFDLSSAVDVIAARLMSSSRNEGHPRPPSARA